MSKIEGTPARIDRALLRGSLPIVCAILVVATLAVYAPVTRFDFVNVDDPGYVSENQMVRGGLTLAGVRWAFTTTEQANWHPLTWLSLMADATGAGPDPAAFHRTNVALHLANVVLLFLVFARMTRSVWRSAFVAGAFALHPLHVESVAWIAERKDLLSTFFWFLLVGAYARYVERPGPGRYVPVVAFLVLGLLAKPMLVTAPLVLLLLDYWPLGRIPLGRGARHGRRIGPLLFEKLPLFAAAFLSGLVTLYAQWSGGAVRGLGQVPLAERAANALLAYAVYVRKMFWPTGLAVYYPFAREAPSLAVVAAGLALAAVTLVALRAARSRPFLAVGWAWYLVTLAPVIGIVQVGRQALADRYTYVPLVGLFVIAAWSVPERWAAPRRAATLAVGAAAALLLTALGVAARAQAATWKDSTTLLSHALTVTSNNAFAHNNLGTELWKRGKRDEAAAHWQEAIRIEPAYPDARANLAGQLLRQGRTEEAIAQCTEALRYDPEHPAALSNLGHARMKQRKLDEAESYLRASLRRRPFHAGTHVNLGTALALGGRLDEAIAEYQEALRIDAGLVEAQLNLGTLLAKRNRREEAAAHFTEALRIDPANEQAQRSLAQLGDQQPR